MEMIKYKGDWYDKSNLSPESLAKMEEYNKINGESDPHNLLDSHDYKDRMIQSMQMFGDNDTTDSIQKLIDGKRE